MRTTGIPDTASWVAIEDPTARLRHGLGELYAYYSANARLLGNVVRDVPLMADIGGVRGVRRAHDRPVLRPRRRAGSTTPRSQRVRMAAIGHAMAFETWRSLTGNGLSDAEASELMVRFVSTVA